MPPRYLFPILVLAMALALPGEEMAGVVDDYEMNVATNCREYPAVGVTDPRACSQIKHQVSQLNYNPVVGNNWNAGEPNNNVNQVKGSCPIGWTALQTGCYRFVEATSFKQAITKCAEKGGFTAEIKCQNEQDSFSQFMKDSPFSNKPVWLGAELVGNKWIWTHSQQEMTFSAWLPRQPSGGRETCVAAWGSGGTTLWNDIVCDAHATAALCQYSLDSVCNPVVGNSDGCDAGWVANQGKCYKLEASPRTLDLAAADCGSKSGQLATIHNMETNLFIKNLLSISIANSIFLGAKSDASNSMKWMVGVNVGEALVTQDFSNGGQTFENAVSTVSAGQVVVMTKGNDEWEIIDNTAHTTRPYVCEKNQVSSNVGFCRWDAFRANTDVASACMCPTSINVCSKRPNCFWYEDPNSPFKECISNSERFYNMLHRLLVRRGKKDFAIKIRYGSTPARGQMPFGPYGPAVIGAGNPNPTSMFGVYGHKNPYDRQRGMGMFGNQGHFGPRRQSQMNPWGQRLPGQSQFGFTRGLQGQMWRGQSDQQMSGQRQQVYHEGNRFNPYHQQNHKQY